MKNRIWLYPLITVFILIFSCNKEKDVFIVYMNINPWIEYGSMTDKDGNTYKTILIGTQTWMAENLKTTKYNDGTAIPLVTNDTAWINLSTPACCWQNNDPARKVTYGVLYNWYTVNTGKLCPIGWHVPSKAEWTILINYLGGEDASTGKLKETWFHHWPRPNKGATNETGFTALPGGDRNFQDGLYVSLGEVACWWSSTPDGKTFDGKTQAWYMWSSIYDNITSMSTYVQGNGYSVRCLKDSK